MLSFPGEFLPALLRWLGRRWSVRLCALAALMVCGSGCGPQTPQTQSKKPSGTPPAVDASSADLLPRPAPPTANDSGSDRGARTTIDGPPPDTTGNGGRASGGGAGGGTGGGAGSGTGGGAGGAGGAANGGRVGSDRDSAGGGGGANPPEIASAVAGDLRIVELLINPAGTDTGREWIEVVNRAGHAVSLSGLHVADAVNDAAVEFHGAAPPVLASGARAVLVQSGDSTKNGGVILGGPIAGGTFGTLVSLNNDADRISLCIGPCASGVLLDRISWDATSKLGAPYDGHALVIDDAGPWCPSPTPFGDAGSTGTPAAPNASCP